MDLHDLSVVTPPPPSPRADVNPNNGIDVNVKYGSFANIQIADSVFSGATEAGVLIHGRNDAPLYNTVPGSLDNVALDRLTVTGNSPAPVSSAGGINVSTATTNVSVHSSRIVGNGSGGLISFADPGPASTIDATDNWWGCNEGPTGDGSNACSTAVQTALGGQIDADPWLVLSASADPERIAPDGATSDVVASLAGNSDGAPAAPPPDGPTVGFTTDLGSLAPSSDALASGEANTVLTSGAVTGIASVTASLDSAQAIAAVEIVGPPVNTSAPVVSGDPLVGSELSCSLGSWDGDDLSFERQWLRDGSDIAGEGDETYATAEEDVGTEIGCSVTARNAVGAEVSETSNAITVVPPPPPPPPAPSADPFLAPLTTGTFKLETIARPRANRLGTTPIAKMTCLSAAGCKLSAPDTITLRVDKKAFKVRVIAPIEFGPDEVRPIGIRLRKLIRRLLRERHSQQVKIKVDVGVTAGGETTEVTLRTRIRAKG
jgi:hypothetical protein